MGGYLGCVHVWYVCAYLCTCIFGMWMHAFYMHLWYEHVCICMRLHVCSMFMVCVHGCVSQHTPTDSGQQA